MLWPQSTNVDYWVLRSLILFLNSLKWGIFRPKFWIFGQKFSDRLHCLSLVVVDVPPSEWFVDVCSEIHLDVKSSSTLCPSTSLITLKLPTSRFVCQPASSVCLSVCLSVCPSVRPSVCPSVCPSAWPVLFCAHWFRFQKKPNPVGFFGVLLGFGQAGKKGKIIQKLSNLKP